MDYRILPPEELPEAEIKLPLSKSMSNRALVINALSGLMPENLKIAGCDDTRLLAKGIVSGSDEVDIDGAGTAMRFLTAYFSIQPHRKVRLTGNERMCQRPIRPLVDALRALGADITYLGEDGFPPLAIKGASLEGGRLVIDASMSSQYVSALLMIAPYLRGGLTLELASEIGSMPYVDMTLEMMRRAGAAAERDRLSIEVKEGGYTTPALDIEADWSAASYWYEIEAVSSGFITLLGLCRDSCQGDAVTAEIYRQISVTTEFNPDYNGQGPAAELCASPDLSPRLVLDLSSYPDLTPAIAVTCALVGIPFRLNGLESLRIKECDRLAAIAKELSKLGVEAEIIGDHALEWTGDRRPMTALPEFDTYGDHRMAMAFAPVAIYVPGIKIRNVEVVNKSYPEFWEHLTEAGFTLVDGDTPYESLFNDGRQEDADR